MDEAADMTDIPRVRRFEDWLSQYEAERSDTAELPVRLGWGTIDAELRGISAGQVLGFAARTSVGKTWALNSIIQTFGSRRDAGALVLSLEMPGPEWAERQLAVHDDVAPEQVEAWTRSGELADHKRAFIERMRNVLLVDEHVDLAEFGDVCDEARALLTVPLRLVVIDYLGLLGITGSNAYERVSAIGKGLKRVAKEQHLAIVVASPLSRAAGDGWQPVTSSHLRDSGVLEESLDFLLGAWQPGRQPDLEPDERNRLRGLVRVAILKNRKGRQGRIVDLHQLAESCRIVELSEEV
jgi:replicative DNA helicase